jgi:hypothetical protein
MRVTKSPKTILSVMVMSFVLASAAHAASSRTYVSNSGSDSNTSSNCGHPAPCGTLAAAYSVTTAGGEIVALDVAGYGPLTITGSVAITAVEGALVNVTTGTTGITVTAGATDVITLRNLQVSGAAGSSNTKGIVLNSGRLMVQDSTFRGLTTALSVNSSKADVTNSDFLANGVAIATTGQGIDTNANPQTGATSVRISNGNVLNNGTAYQMNNPGVSANCASCNRYSISARTTGSGITVNQAGNTNLALGSGASCDPTVSQGCLSINSYLDTTNQQGL